MRNGRGMSLFNFEDQVRKAPRNRKSLKLIVGIGALAGVIAIGSTLAANLNLNTGKPVEFGQGVAQTTACSGTNSILVTPNSTFQNAATPITATPLSYSNTNHTDIVEISSTVGITVGMYVNGAGYEPDLARVSNVFGGNYVAISEARQPENIEDPLVFTNSGDFMATSITVSQIPASCQNKIFRVKVYGNNGADPITVAKFDSISPDGFVDIWWGSGYRPSSPGVSDLQIPTGYAVIDFQNGLWTGRSTDGIGSNGNPLHPFLLTSATPDTTFTQTNAQIYFATFCSLERYLQNYARKPGWLTASFLWIP